jgi:SAM-dependent methyltransferase
VNNRRFLGRVVGTLAAQYGVRQFIDHGCGLPSQINVHHVAQSVARESRVVYVDNDPMVLAHARALMEDGETSIAVQADIRDTEAVFTHPDTRRLIDFSQPVAALFVSVLHCLPDDDDDGAEALVRRVVQRLAPGSFVVLSQLVSQHERVRDFVTGYMHTVTSGEWGRVRTEDEVNALLGELEILEPGLSEVSLWRPDNEVVPRQRGHELIVYGGVGRVPG